MNKKIFTLIVCIVLTTLSANAQMFKTLSNNKDISTVYVSKTLLKLASGMDIDMGGVDIKSLINKLDGVEIYTSENTSGTKEIDAMSQKVSESKDYELLMKVNEDGDGVTFYIKQDSKEIITDLIMFSKESSEATIIRITGAFTMEDIQKIVKCEKCIN